jgi:hypothetical protein
MYPAEPPEPTGPDWPAGPAWLAGTTQPHRPARRRPNRVTPRQAGALAVLWLFLALFFGALYRVADATEHHAYNSGDKPPAFVTLTDGKHYQLSTKGGQSALVADGQQISTADCHYQVPGGTPQVLGATAVADDSGATHVVATFVAPVGGRVQITCAGLGPVFVDDADSSTLDLAIVFVLMSSGLASLGVILGLWALYAGSQARLEDASRDDVEVDGGVQPVDN